jgi:hypothetical protein
VSIGGASVSLLRSLIAVSCQTNLIVVPPQVAVQLEVPTISFGSLFNCCGWGCAAVLQLPVELAHDLFCDFG